MPLALKKPMPVTPKYLHAQAIGRPIGVDRKKNILQGFVVAQLGPFKTDGRGEFDLAALQQIVKLGNAAPRGLKSRFTHPDMSSDGLGKHLGRATDFSMSTAIDARLGRKVPAVRADLTFDRTALEQPPNGGRPYGDYIMSLAESDSDAFSSSLVLESEQSYRLDGDGSPATDLDGNELPPLWMPTKLHAADIVSDGDAVDSALSAELSIDGLPLAELWKGAALLDNVFANQSREVIFNRCMGFLSRYLDRKFGIPEPLETPRLDRFRKALSRMQEKIAG